MVKNIQLKNIKLDIKLLLIFILLLIFTFTIIRLGSFNVDAQIVGFGTECVDNSGNCSEIEGSYGNIVLDILSGDIEAWEGGFITSLPNQINDSLKELEAIGGRQASNVLCYNKESVSGFIPLPVQTFDSNTMIRIDNGTGSAYVLSACSSSTAFGATTPMTTGSENERGDIWGCCPTGYFYAPSLDTDERNTDFVNSNNSACCYDRPGLDKNNIFYNKEDGGCFDNENGQYVSAVPNSKAETTGAIAMVNGNPAVIDDLSIIQGNYNIKDGNNSSVVDYAPIPNGSLTNCPDKNGCTIVSELGDGSSLSPNVVKYITSAGKTLKIVKSDLLDTETGKLVECSKCYSDGEVIAIGGEGSESKETLMLRCDVDSADLIESVELRNNSITDTLAWLAAQDPENQDFIEDCRAQGGIPTAIGCIDTTPIGIITGLIRIALGVMGGVALVQLILVGINYQRGNEAEIKKAREQLVATLTGLAVLVFSVLILRIIGVNILDILPAGSL